MLKNFSRRLLKALITTLLIFSLTSFFCISAFAVYVKTSPALKIDELCTLARAQDRTTRLYYTKSDSDGNIIAAELESEALYADQNREWIKYENIPKNLINAFVAIEDHRFFEHGGVDIKRTAGAIFGFVTGKSSYGGSTITQQLIKNVTGDSSYSVSRKIKELVRAKRLDNSLTKEEILELYLNTIYLARGSYGIGTAAKTYFDKEISELTLAECASIACIAQSPTKWEPISNPKNNAERRQTVLYRMKALGYISQSDLDNALKEEPSVSNERTRNASNGHIYSWYTESVIDETIRLLTENGVASNEQTAKKLLYTGGLSIITAQNPKMQEAVEKYFENEKNFYSSELLIHPECSIVVTEPKSGRILALAGGTGKKTANRVLNYATSTHRSPGSSIKPLSVYAPAIDKGIITYATVFDDTPVRFVSNGMGGMRGWPQNYPCGYRGLTTVRDAISRSVNTVAVKALSQLGHESTFNLLKNDLGMKSLVSRSDKNNSFYTDIADSPIALGQLTRGVTVSEITGAYTSLAGDGKFSEAHTVLKIFDSDGKLLVNNTKESKRVFSEESAAIMTKLLQGVTSSGTASKITLKKSVACAGKTGTTTSDCDRWFIGYTPDLLAGVWFGYPTPKSLDGYPTAASPALKAFDDVMKIINTEEYLGYTPKLEFECPESVVTANYCRDSGKLVTSACMCDPRGCRIETGYFTKETLPSEYCDVHTMVLYDTKHGGIAGDGCNRENCKYVGLLKVNRSFPYPVVIADSEYTYQALEAGAPPCFDASKPYFYFNTNGSKSGMSNTDFPFNRYCACNLVKPPTEDYEDITEAENGGDEK